MKEKEREREKQSETARGERGTPHVKRSLRRLGDAKLHQTTRGVRERGRVSG